MSKIIVRSLHVEKLKIITEAVGNNWYSINKTELVVRPLTVWCRVVTPWVAIRVYPTK